LTVEVKKFFGLIILSRTYLSKKPQYKNKRKSKLKQFINAAAHTIRKG
jgi:hypothetical protein